MLRRGNILILFGFILIVAASILTLVNIKEEAESNNQIASITSELVSIPEKPKIRQPIRLEITTEEIMDEYSNDQGSNTLNQKSTIEIDGNAYMGLISIPKIGLDVPVMDNWSYPKLKVSPCRFLGSLENNDLVVAGHNYKSHFSNIKKLSIGDALQFKCTDGEVIGYTVSDIEVVNPNQLDRIIDTEYDLILFTCTSSGTQRFLLKCTRTI